MNAGQKVRIKPDSRVGAPLEIAPETSGTVLCRYRLLRDDHFAPDRVDVCFGPRLFLWGAADVYFEVVSDAA